MTSQEKKKYLSQYSKIDRLIDSKLLECEKWRARAEKMSPSYSALPKANSGENSLELAVEHIVELEKEIDKEVDKLVELRRSIQQAIYAIEDDHLKELLEYRYIKGMKWEEVAVKMNYDYRWVLRLHGKALSQLAIESHI